MARLNRRVINPVQRVWAPYLPPYALIEHVGRRSGRRYTTPVIATKGGDTLFVPVLYGERSDWLLNLLAAGGGRVRRLGRTYELARPSVGDAADAPGVAGRVLGRVSGRVLSARLQPPSAS